MTKEKTLPGITFESLALGETKRSERREPKPKARPVRPTDEDLFLMAGLIVGLHELGVMDSEGGEDL